MRSTARFKKMWASAFTALTLLVSCTNVLAQQVNIYSFRQDFLVRPLLDEFEDKTGIMVNIVSGSADAIIERLRIEGNRSLADILLTVDAGRLVRAKELHLLQPVYSPYINSVLSAKLQDRDGYWFALSIRARPIVYNKQNINPSDLKTYADLADPKWKGRLCLRSSSNIYNQSLVAAYIANFGEKKARSWISGMIRNLAKRPQGGDIDQIKLVSSGVCDLTLANTYYLARMSVSNDPYDHDAAKNVGVIWPNQDEQGTHINISGVAVTKYAPNKTSAIKFIEFLLQNDAQHLYTELLLEYPVLDGVAIALPVKNFGAFKEDTLDLEVLGKLNAKAQKIMQREGWE